MSEVLGQPLDRIDGPLKVTGGARYAAEYFADNLAYAVILQSEVPSGRVRLDAEPARRTPGVLAVLTHDNMPALPEAGRAAFNPPAGRVMSLLQNDAVHYNGEPIAVVVAESFEIAEAAARAIEVAYAASAAHLSFDQAKQATYAPDNRGHGEADHSWGDIEGGLACAQVRIEHTYTTPMEHHNPLEPHATLAQWEGNRLTLYDATQYVSGVRETVAKTLGIAADNVRVVNPYVGGGFGCKGSTWSHVVLAAVAAQAVARPVKLVLSRPQMFGPVGGRPQTEQRVLLAARTDGRLLALRHDVVSHTSVLEDYVEQSTQPARALHACENGATTQRLVKLNVGVPTFQRAPGESTGNFAIESAMDELAWELGMDPLALHLCNDAETESSTGKRWTSKRLRSCYEIAAAGFGWSRRNPVPRSQRDGRELVGMGMATASYPAHRVAASACAQLSQDGTVLVQSGTQDLGTGTYTLIAQIAAQALGIPVGQVRVELGDTALPRAPISGGSMTAASVGPAVQRACVALRAKVIARATGDRQSGLHGVNTADIDIQNGWLVARDGRRRESLGVLAARLPEAITAQEETKPDEGMERFASRSFGAVFCEVRVDPRSGVVRVPRIVARYSVGCLMNRKTAASQIQGGIVFGVGQALLEKSVLDARYGRFVNANLAEYHVPVNADINLIDVDFVDETDRLFSPLGGRGIGEIGITGVAAAIANAVFHATGRRIRDLPITLDKLL